MKTIGRFIKYYKPYKKLFFLDLLCAILISLIDLAYPQFLRKAINTLFMQTGNKILDTLLPLFAILLLIYIVQSLCKYFVGYKGHMMGSYMEQDMRQELFEHYEKLSFSYYDKHNSGQMINTLISDLFDISEFAHHAPENLFISLIKIVGSFTFLFIINWQLAIPLAVLTVIMFLFSYFKNKKMLATFMEYRACLGDMSEALQDTLGGIRVMKSFANEKIEKEKFTKRNRAFLNAKDANYKVVGSFQAGNAFIQGLIYITTLVLGGFLIAKGQMTVSDLAIYALYIGIFTTPIIVLIDLIESIQKGLSGFKRFADVMDCEPDIVDSVDAKDLTNVAGNISYKNVSFAYNNDETVLHDISFDIPAGKSIALVGASGGGKSTICSLLPRFYDIKKGSITVDGHDIKKLSLHSLRNHIGIVQQDVFMFYGTVKENISYGKPNATDEEIIEAAKKANIHDFVMSLPQKYDTFVGERGTRLSGGQKQRIAIARVFLKNSPILILDEATSALDNESEQYIQASLDSLAMDRTAITIAHRLSTIRNADEILVIEHGSIVERGSHDELLNKNGLYAHYYNMQFKEQT